MVIASEDATFGLPEVDRGALGAATHLARLVPQHAMRKMVYTAKPITAAELAAYGSVAAVVPPDRLRAAALELAAEIAAKSPTIIRRAKESLNGIDPVDVKRSYRFEQGFTYELHVRGVADEQRAAFVEKRDADTSIAVSDKRTTVDDIVGELRSGMTIGIGGWGSRRKPMAVVRALCRSDLTDLTVVAYGGPDVGPALRHGQGAQGRVRLRHPRLHRARSPLAGGPPARPGRGDGGRRGHVLPRAPGGGVAGPLPAHPGRAGLRRPHHQPRPARSSAPPTAPTAPTWPTRPTPTSSWSPCRPSTSMRPSSTPTGPTPPATARSSSPDPFFDPLFLGAAERRFVTTERIVENGALADEGHPISTVPIHRMLTDGVAETPGGAHFTANPPDYGRDEAFQKEYAAAAGDPAEWEAFADALRPRRRRRVPGPRRRSARTPVSDIRPACTRAESCVIACADAWRDAGEVMASPFGTIPVARGPAGQAAPSRPTSCSPTARPP